jgi:hypothetical protein
MPYDSSEQEDIIEIFSEMLRAATGDGGKKRAAGLKPSWKVDPSHEAAIFSHLSKWKHGEKSDPDSGAHPLVHLAWRALAVAWQETHAREEGVWEIAEIIDVSGKTIVGPSSRRCWVCGAEEGESHSNLDLF